MMAQIANTTRNLDAGQLIIIKGSMTWKLKKMQQDNYTSTNNENNEQLFVKFHMANLITRNVLNINDVWYVDFKISNHMIRHGK
jgi:hypothetical protein